MSIDLSTTHYLVNRPNTFCTVCNTPLDICLGHGEPPRHGDLCVCMTCGEMMIFHGQNNKLCASSIPNVALRDLSLRNPDFYQTIVDISAAVRDRWKNA